MDLSKSIDRFLEPQKTAYPTALAEVSRGRKESHWMWYIFPQLRGLGRSTLAWYYGLKDLAEARVYLDHPVLGPLLREITAAVLALPEADPARVFGWPDNMKFRSCLTLFAQVSEDDLFVKTLDKFFGGEQDPLTLELLEENG